MIKNICSIGSTWNQNGWLKWAGLGLLGLLLVSLLSRCTPIEKDLDGKTQSLLSSEGMGWAKTSFDGRDLTMTGEAPSADARDSAVEMAQGIYGVRTVDHNVTLKQWVSSKLNIQQKDDMLVLTGSLPDQASIDAAVSQAHSLYGDAKVSNKLEISDSANTPKWLAGTTGLMAALYSARNLALKVSDDQVELSGDVETEAEKAQIIAQAKASYGDKFSESIAVVKTKPTAEELAAIAEAKRAEEQRLIDEAQMAADAEAARLAEKQRLAAEAKAAQLAEEERLAAAAEEKRLAAERLAAEAETARLAKEARLAEIAAEKKRLAAIEVAKIKAAEEDAALLATCQTDLSQLLNQNSTIFNDNTPTIRGESYRVLGMLAQKINYCSDILHAKKQCIDVSAHAGEGEIAPMGALMKQQRVHSVISYLEAISGAHAGLLRPSSTKTADTTSGNSQLNFTITE